jgi:hypothetical protein
MPLLGWWFPPVGTFGSVLALAGSLVSLLAFTGWKRITLALMFIFLGLGEIVSVHKADTAHEIELRNQHSDLEKLTKELRNSETQRQVEHAVLRTKLEDFAQLSQLGPALMKLAQTSADFQKKQYETKIMSDRDLHDLTMKAVREIRDFSLKYSELELKQILARNNAISGPVSEVDWRKTGLDEFNRSVRMSRAKYSEFQTTILPDVMYARNELIKAKLPEPVLDPSEKTYVDIALKGMLAGINPEMSLATHLELWAKPLAGK